MYRKQFGYSNTVCVFLSLSFFLFLLPFSFSFGLIPFDQPRFLFYVPHKKPNYTEFQDCFQQNSEKWVSEQSQLLVVVVYNLSYVICYVECIREKRENAHFIFFTHNERHQQWEWEQKKTCSVDTSNRNSTAIELAQ